MSKNTNYIFKGLSVVAWIIFIGLCIEAGALIVNFIFSIYNPVVVKNLYQKLDLSDLYNRSRWAFYGMYSFILIIAVLKSFLFYVVIKLTTKLNLSKPFSSFVSEQISLLSYFTLSIGLLSYIARETSKYLEHHDYEISSLNQFWSDSQAFILMAAVIYIIAQIFKRGIALQEENDLTI